MAGAGFKKRSRDDAPRIKPVRPSKKQKKQAHAAYHSSSESENEGASDAEDGDDFEAVNLLDSDEEDIHNVPADDGGADSGSGSDGGSTSESEVERAPPKKRQSAPPSIAKNAPPSKLAKDAPASDGSESNSDEPAADEDDNDEYSDLDKEGEEHDDDEDDDDDEAGSDDDNSGNEDGGGGGGAGGKQKRANAKNSSSKSKRNDPTAFATSLSKILNTKLSTTRRADPVLARSAAAHEASRQAVDNALETKARKKMREAKLLAMEKGRVRDVLVATNAGPFGENVNPVTGEVAMMTTDVGAGETVGQRLATEKRLRKVAQRGVVQLFNAFRTAQAKAVEAERAAKKDGVVGVDRKKDKVTELSKKGFLDLIAAGGGGLKKAALEEA